MASLLSGGNAPGVTERAPLLLWVSEFHARLAAFLHFEWIIPKSRDVCGALSGMSRLFALSGRVRVPIPVPDTPKRLIVHAETGKFLKADGSWTEDESEAMNFNDIAEVITACSRHHVRNAQMLFRFRSGHDVRIPLRSTTA